MLDIFVPLLTFFASQFNIFFLKLFFTIFTLIFLTQPVYAKRLKHEDTYQKEWCAKHTEGWCLSYGVDANFQIFVPSIGQ
jgi:hypothetical protein